MKQKVNLVTFEHGDLQIAQTVKAIVIGPLAVHRELGTDYNRWAVSHVRTGFKIRGGIKSKARALRVAEALQFLDWNFRSPRSRKVKAMASKATWAINLTL